MNTPDNEFVPDWDEKAVLVEEVNRIAGEFARASELLWECEMEMTYSDWAVYQADNPRRNELYKKIRQFTAGFFQLRKWVRLSPEDYADLRSGFGLMHMNDFEFSDLVSTIQAKLKEKNT